MDLPTTTTTAAASRSRNRRRNHRSVPFLLLIALLVLSVPLVLRFSPPGFFFVFSTAPATSVSVYGDVTGCGVLDLPPEFAGERFLWYAPHSGFSNQVGELRNAAVAAAILNRTLVVPPVFDHHAVKLGSCPKFRVEDPRKLRADAWDHAMDLAAQRRYVSLADIIDLSSIPSTMLKTIDFRVFASMWCGIDMRNACFSEMCCSATGGSSLQSRRDHCRALISGTEPSTDGCVHNVEQDCRNTVWTYLGSSDGMLDPFQPDADIKRKKMLSYVRRRRDIYQAFGPGSKAYNAAVLAFGTVFSSPYKGSELYFDIKESSEDSRIQSLLVKIRHLPFAREIVMAGKEFATVKIKEPFLCAQLRLLDGQFKYHWKATFSALKEKLKSLDDDLKGRSDRSPVNLFIMTDLPLTNWSQTYLGEIAKDKRFRVYTLREDDEFVLEAARKLMSVEHGLQSRNVQGVENGVAKENCEPGQLPDILLYVEESICSCASLGFVGTAGSTITDSIELMRRRNDCR